MSKRDVFQPPPRDQLAAWKQAIGRHRKQQRQQRRKRPQPPVTGYRIPAPPSDKTEGE